MTSVNEAARDDEYGLSTATPWSDRRYRVRTLDLGAADEYTPQVGLSVPSEGLTLSQLRQAVRELRQLGYTAHRVRDEDGDHCENDYHVLIERTV